jgi:hypothetical protein
MNWLIERDSSGIPVRLWWRGAERCKACNGTGWLWLTIEGARVPQRRPCRECP